MKKGVNENKMTLNKNNNRTKHKVSNIKHRYRLASTKIKTRHLHKDIILAQRLTDHLVGVD